jgi:hypothetical protein
MSAQEIDISTEGKKQGKPDFGKLKRLSDNKFDAVTMHMSLQRMLQPNVLPLLQELKRIMKVDGLIHISVPDAQKAADFVYRGLTDEAVTELEGVENKDGKQKKVRKLVTPVDMLYGHKDVVNENNIGGLHKCCFTATSLGRALKASGFKDLQVKHNNLEIIAAGRKPVAGYDTLNEKIVILDAPQSQGQNDELDLPPVQWQPLGLNRML